MDLNKKIEKIEFPSIKNYNIVGLDEKLINLKNIHEKIICESQYYKQGIPGALKDCYVRESLVEMLLNAVDLLPKNIGFKIYDGFRPYAVQKRLWNFYYMQVKNNPQNINCSDEELELKTSFFVSKPTLDIDAPFLHGTGGAIDLTLINLKTKEELDMGTEFDDFSNKAWTNHFEDTDNLEIIKNRRMLYNVMIEVGFTNLPSEWWHYDYGTKFWAYFMKRNALYKGIIKADIDLEEFPLN